MILECTLTFMTLLALFGALLVSLGNVQGFVIWCITNAFFAYHNYSIEEFQMCSLFSAYFILALVGVYNGYKSKGAYE